jgi:hypothetical protein
MVAEGETVASRNAPMVRISKNATKCGQMYQFFRWTRVLIVECSAALLRSMPSGGFERAMQWGGGER